ncbi:hypothetical protein E0Z10_g5441 [Xylaria hypoxylon]|uniref:Uncharacterized protein n=1 Tax=Xylaria hypoxylon TaxID=37992 RepID=A0A4Z0YXW1_9PEZI|nr:hypothetical protein E0Z10_g5441 [Xylaria hypoxylon]
MIARGAPVGAVCFRCRLRLLRQLTPIRRFASDATTAPYVDNRVDNRADNRADGDTSQDADQGQSYESRGRVRSGVKRLDLRKRHLSGNRVFTETTASLGSDMLGKPAYAIVMRDAGRIQRKKIPLIPSEIDAEPSGDIATRIEALLGSQREPATLHEVRSNIQGLQPQADNNVLSEKDFRRLQRVLHKGFLSHQIKEYIQWHKSDAQDKSQETATDSASHPEFPWIREMTPWVPLQSKPNAAKITDPTLLGYASNTTPPKERLVIRLMHECWGLSIAELETQLGETQIKLHNNEFILLMRGTQRFMNALGKIWLAPGEQIEAFQDQQTLRLVTTRPKAESLIRDLDNTLKSVRTKTFPVILFGSEAPDDKVLEELGRITNSHIRKSHTLRREQLHVTWIELAVRAARGLAALEDIAHIALRLLLTASGSQQASSSLLSPMLPQAHTGRFVVDVTNKDKLGWKDRLAQWARYVYPLTPKKSAVNTALPIEKFELPFEPLERPEKFREEFEFFPQTKFPSHPVKWSNTTQTSTAAHFGHILHPYQPLDPTPALSDLLASTERRIFAPSTPHPLYLTKFETNGSNNSSNNSPLVTTRSTLVLRFWPSPSSNPTSKPSSSKPPKKASSRAGDAPPAPILELRLATSDRKIKRIESLRAIRRTHHTDVMLPESPIDVRFTQTQYETLQAPDDETLNAWQPLFDFLTCARFDLENGKLEMPPSQRFPIPRRLFAIDPTPTSPPSNTLSTTKDPNPVHHEHQPEDPDDLVSISYEFVGLELHRSATLPYEGHQLTYTSIEAGRGGGRRVEVILEPQKPPHSIPTWPTEEVEKDRLQEDFLACCSRFVQDRSLWSGL